MEESPKTPNKIVYPADGSIDHSEEEHKAVFPVASESPLSVPEEPIVDISHPFGSSESLISTPEELVSRTETEFAAPDKLQTPEEGIESTDTKTSPIESHEHATEISMTQVSEMDTPPPPPTESNASPFEEHLVKAAQAKQAATEAYKKSDLATAKLNYLIALETLQVDELVLLFSLSHDVYSYKLTG